MLDSQKFTNLSECSNGSVFNRDHPEHIKKNHTLPSLSDTLIIDK